MQASDIAAQIPAHIRKEILERDIIVKAMDVNEYMKYLFEVWYLYMDPNSTTKNWDCAFCRATVKTNFTNLLPALVELQKQQNLLDAI